MDPKLIYRKTPQGEEALKARTQLKSGRLRSVLIMVDGQASVGDLSLRLGRKNRPDDRLAQLERLGLIEPVPQARRSKPRNAVRAVKPEPGSRSVEARPIPAAAAPEAPAALESSGDAPGSGTHEPAPAPSAAPADSADVPAAETGAEPEPAPVQAQESSPPPPADGAAETLAEAGRKAEEEPAAEVTAPPAASYREPEPGLDGPSPLPDAVAIHDDERAVEEPAQGRTAWAARLRSAFARHRPFRAPAAPPRRAPASRRGPGPVTWIGVPVLALVAAAALLPEYLRPDIERWAAQRLGQPVGIDRVAFAWQPSAGLRLEGVAVGGSRRLAYAASVVVSPSAHVLEEVLKPRFDLDIAGAALEGEAVVALCAVAGLDSATARASRIDSVAIDGLTLDLRRARLDDLRADIRLDAGRDRPEVALADAGGRLRVDLSPSPGGCRFSARGSGWHPPLAGGVTLDALKASGTVDDKALRLESFDARTSDGLIAGSGSLAWEPRATLDLRFELQHLDLAKLLAALGVPASARGELDARLQFGASATQLAQLPATLGGGGPVTVSRGAIERFDLVEAARSPGAERVHGGALRFEQLHAQLQIDRGSTALRNVRLNAGALSADGVLAVKRDFGLSGSMIVHLESAGGPVRVPLRVAGSVAAPELGTIAEPAAAPPPGKQ